MFCEAFMLSINSRIPRDVCVFSGCYVQPRFTGGFLGLLKLYSKRVHIRSGYQKVTNMDTLNITP